MPELYDDVKEKQVPTEPSEQQIIDKLFDYLEGKNNPFRANYLETIRKCYRFKEGDQWEEIDKTALEYYGVPAIPVDRISRGLDTIEGIRENTDFRKRILKSQLGDDSIATLLDKVYDHFETNGEFGEAREEAFKAMLDVGLGERKVGFDFGKRKIWAEFVNTEDFYWAKCKSKRLLDCSWFCQVQTMSWEDAMLINPEKAGELKGLKGKVESEWEKLNTPSNQPVTVTTQDYGSQGTIVGSHPDQVKILEFWKRRIIPFVKVGFVQMVPQDMGGMMVPVPQPGIRKEALDYKVQEGEKALEYDKDEIWEQFIVASGGNKLNSILLKQGQSSDHPFVSCCADRKKTGEPVGYIEKNIPGQIRVNLAWAQETAWNNKSIKSAIVLEGNVTPEMVEQSIYQSKIGAVMIIPQGASWHAAPALQLNTQAIQSGQQARIDMDFASAATQDVMRGESASGDSGIKTSVLQNAAITPLNKWVKAFEKSEYDFTKKVLKLIIQNVKPMEMMRIVGPQVWQTLGLQFMPPSPEAPDGVILSPDGQPLNLSILDYDAKIENQAVSDMSKQQAFNAIAALQSLNPMGMFTDDYMIKNAPIKNVDDALESNLRHRQDILMQLMAQNQMLQEQNQDLQKQVPKQNNQKGNAQKGKSAPQSGRQSMLGGAGPKSPVGGGR